MPTVIDSLQIEIQSGSENASKGIDSLVKSLEDLKTTGKLTTVVKNLQKLNSAVKGFSNAAGASSTMHALANAIEKLRSVGSIASITNNLAKLPGALKGLESVNLDTVAPQIQRIADAATPLTELKTSGLSSMVNAMAKIGKVTKDLDDEKIAAFADRVKKLYDIVLPLSEKMKTIGSGFSAISSGAEKATKAVEKMDHGIETSTHNLANFIDVARNIAGAIANTIRAFTDITAEAIEWDGIAARFGRSFGAQAEETYEWIQRLNKEMGINVQQFMQYSSLYAQMLTGFGVASEDASKMALGYTELTYDIWAGANDRYKTFADAAEAVASAISGEVEPIRRAGFTIVESTLEQTAANHMLENSLGDVTAASSDLVEITEAGADAFKDLTKVYISDQTLALTAANHGLTFSIEKATEAQKSYLRYLTLVDQAQATGLIGTYAKELNTAEGMTRTLAQQIKSLTQAFGSLFLPILVKIIPYVQAFVELLTDAIHAVAAFFGIKIQDIGDTWGDYGSDVESAAENTQAVTGALGDAAKAAKELKNASIGIDELNVISPSSANSGSSGGAGGSGGMNGFESLDVDSLWDESIFDSIQSDVERIKGVIVDALTVITGIASGFALAIGTILVVTGANIPLGIGLMAVGAVGLVATVAANWDSMSNDLAEALTTITSTVGGFLLAVGAILAFSGANIPLGIGLMAAGAVSIGTAAVINWKKLDGDIEGTVSLISGTVGGALLGLGAILAFSGVNIPLGVAFMAAGAVGLATSVAINWNGLSGKVKGVIADIEAAVGGGLLAVGALLAFTGIAIPLGISLMAAGAVSLASAAVLNWSALNSNAENAAKTLSSIMSGSLLAIGGLLAFTGVNIPLGIALLAIGAVSLATQATLNWKSLDSDVKKTIEGITAAVASGLLAVGAILAFSGVATLLGISLMAAGAVGLASTAAANWSTITNKVKTVVKDVGIAMGGALLALGAILCLSGVALPLGLALLAAGGASLAGGVALNWNALKDKLKDAWEGVKEWWDKKPKLSEYTPSIGKIWEKVKSAWEDTKTWWKDKRSNLSYTPSIGKIWENLKSAWTTAKDWWNKSRSNLSYTPSIGKIWENLKTAWTSAKDWWNKSRSSLSYTPTIGSIKDKVSSAWSAAKTWWKNNVSGLSTKLDIKVPKISIKWKTTEVLGKSFKYPSGFDIDFAANGGIFDAGSLIWAGERGAEVVANAGGGKTGVMNVQQMQEAVYEGVYAAMSAAMSRYGSDGAQAVNVYLDSRQITSTVEQRQRERGVSLMGKEVFG